MSLLSDVFIQITSHRRRRRAQRHAHRMIGEKQYRGVRLPRAEQLEQRNLLHAATLHHDDPFSSHSVGESPDHEQLSAWSSGVIEAPILVDFGGAGPNAPVAGIEPWLGSGAALTGEQKVMVLRVYFDDYSATSRYSRADVEGFFSELDQLWQDTSYGNISVSYQVTELYALPEARSSYIDDLMSGDLSNDGKFDKVLEDAIAAAPTDAGLEWSDLSAVFVVMAETDVSQFHRGQATGRRNLPMGPGGSRAAVGAGIFSENPSETDRQVWGRWAHELGHAFQDDGPAHPSNYNSEFELMDSNYPGQVGVVAKLINAGFRGWMPEPKYQVFTPFGSGQPGEGGGIANIWAMEYSPGSQPNFQALKVEISEDLYYMVSVRRRILGDDLNGGFTSPPGIPDEGVLIEKVEEGADPWVTLMAPPGATRNDLWQAGDVFDAGDVVIEVVQKIDPNGDNYQIRVRYTSEFGSQPDVAMEPWISPPGNTYETTDIWIDSPVNGYDDGSFNPDAFSYGIRTDLSGNPVPIGNGDVPAIGQRNRLYARVRNLGGLAATNVVVNWEITDPAIAGVGPGSPWTAIGTVTQANFAGLASIPGGGFVDVYVEWTPDFAIPEEVLEEGLFQLHRCVRVVIDPLPGETVLGNQDGVDEQENIVTFQAIPESTAAGAPLTTTILLHNPLAIPKYYYLDYESNVPNTWRVEINGGELGLQMAANEIRQIPVVIHPAGPAVLGTVLRVEIRATSTRELVSDLDPTDTHIEFHSLGGVVVETRVQRRPTIDIQQADRLLNGSILVRGRFNVQGFSSLYDPAHPFRVMVQAVDGNRRFQHNTMQILTVAADGTFQGQINDPTPNTPVLEIVAMFAGTAMLASASTGYVDTVPTDFYYAYDTASNRIVQIDALGGQVIAVGPTGISDLITGLALTNSGVLYGHSADLGEFGGNNFYRFDRLTGAATLVGSIDQVVGGGMAYDPETDTIFTTAAGGFLVRINPNTGRGTRLGDGTPGLTSPAAAAFDTRSDRLIVFDNADDQFYAFDPSTGNATLLDSASPALNSTAMAYDGSRFVMNDTGSRTLRAVNPNTGSSSVIVTTSETLSIAALEFVGRFRQRDLLGIDLSSATLYDVDPVTGTVSGPRPTGLEDTVGIAFAKDHTLYTLTSFTASTNPNSLFSVDRVSGAATLVGPTGLNQIIEADLDFDPMTGILYGLQNISPAGQRQLFTIDVGTGRATLVGPLGTGDYSAMAFDARGNLYVLNADSNTLLRVNKSSGATISSTPLSRNLGSLAGMDFDPTTGFLYVVDGGTSGTDILYTLNPNTGLLTPTGRTGLADGLAGLAYVPITGAIRGNVFNDHSGNGVRNAGEEGLPNRQVFLDENDNGVLDPITTTSRLGAAGGIPNVGAVPFPLVATGLIAPIVDLNVTLNIVHPRVDLLDAYLVSPRGTRVELFSPGRFSGGGFAGTFDDEALQAEGILAAFDGEDLNGTWLLVISDSFPDGFSGGLASWSIQFSHGEQVVTTGAGGDYVFTGLKPDTYTVAAVQQGGWLQTFPWAPSSHRVTLGTSQVRTGRDFGNFRPGEIRGSAFNDGNSNGVRDAGEEGLPNWQIFLDANENGVLNPITTTTRPGSAGTVPDIAAIPFPLIVTGLVAPIVDLNVTLNVAHPRVDLLDAYLISPMGTRAELFSPGRFSGGGITAAFDDEALQAEGILAAFDGEDPNGVWLLVVSDLVQDNFFTVVPAWSIQFSHGEQVATTGASGDYAFAGLKPDTYTVAELQQAGWIQTFPASSFHNVPLSSGQSAIGRDFGNSRLIAPVLPGDYNRDGIVDTIDYVLQRKTEGMFVAPFSGADGNGDGVISDVDYGIWRANFGKTTASAAGEIAAARGRQESLVARSVAALRERGLVAWLNSFSIGAQDRVANTIWNDSRDKSDQQGSSGELDAAIDLAIASLLESGGSR